MTSTRHRLFPGDPEGDPDAAPGTAEETVRYRRRPSPMMQTRIEDVSELLNQGVRPEEICRRLGVSAAALAGGFRRALRTDLAKPFGALDRREHRARAKESS